MADRWDWVSPSGLIAIQSDEMRTKIATPAEGKLAIKELRLLKKQLGLQKREVNAELQALRTQYSQSTKRRGSSVRGGGSVGRFFRSMDQLSRDSQRSTHANALDPYLAQRARIDERIGAVDQMIIKIEAVLLQNELDEANKPEVPVPPSLLPSRKNFCNQCGSPRAPNVKFCGQCGSQLG